MRAKPVGLCVTVASVLAVVSVGSVPATGQEQNAGGGRGREPTSAPAEPIPRTADGRPDMRGRWTAPPLLNSNIIEEHPGGFGIQAGKSLVVDPPDGVIPYQPWALAQRNENRRPENAYLDNEGKCMVSGMPRVMLFSFEIVYAPHHMALMFEPNFHGNRIISMDARKHLPDGIRLYMGDPVGRWEGDTLLEDTCHEGNADLVHLKNLYDADHTARGR